MEDITDENYTLAKRVCKDFETKKLGKYYDLCVQSDTLLLADVLENFRNLSCCTRISMTRILKKDESKIKSFNRY